MEYIPAKSIITRTKDSAWFGIDYNMNIYRGCSHGCIYCDSRSDCYHNEQFDKIKVKSDALTIIRNDLRRKVKKGVVGTGAMSDPYNPIEREMKLSRNALELINAYGFGASIATKSPLVTRDADILRDIKAHSPVLVKITITTCDDSLSKLIEPNAAPSSQRFEAVKALSSEGLFTGILLMPVLPFIEDNLENITSLIRIAKENGARFIYPAFGMTMRQGQREYYYQALDKHFPGLKEKYIRRYGSRYTCSSPNAKALWSVFASQCDSQGILYKMQDIIRSYKMGYGSSQLSLIPDEVE